MALTLKIESNRRSIISIASKYGFEEKHAYFVEGLALQIFDLLSERFSFKQGDRMLLSHASLLHDIGCFINHKKHHKYSKYIIEHDAGFNLYNSRKRHLLALIVYNHRKKLHKKTLLLSKSSRSAVLMLSAILRIADALDHTREDINILGMDCTDTELTISIAGVMPEKLAGRMIIKKTLFRDVFDMDVVLQG